MNTATQNKPPLIWLMGSFGVGKSSIIEQPGEQVSPMFWKTDAGYTVFGDRAGADALSRFTKNEAHAELNRHTVPMIVTGVFYSSVVDLAVLQRSHDVHALFLKTSKANNRKRIQIRGGKFNEQTWASNNTKFNNLFTVFQPLIPCIIIDNDQPLVVTRNLFWSYALSLLNH